MRREHAGKSETAVIVDGGWLAQGGPATYSPSDGSQSSILLPSGSFTHAKFP
jgi:hypothetical protein